MEEKKTKLFSDAYPDRDRTPTNSRMDRRKEFFDPPKGALNMKKIEKMKSLSRAKLNWDTSDFIAKASN